MSGKRVSTWLFRAPRVGGSRDDRPHPERGRCLAAARPPPVPFPDEALWARVTRYARCADSTLDPDQWFPVSAEADKARHEAAAAITVCTTCLVRTQCLALSLRHWDIGQYGVWGGLVPADRTALRRRKHPSAIRPVPRLTGGSSPVEPRRPEPGPWAGTLRCGST